MAILAGLIVGKTLGIASFALLGRCLGFPLPPGMSVGDLFTMASLGSIGLTVALFMSNSAFVDAGLQGQAKFGAVLSVGAVFVSLVLSKLTASRTGDAPVEPTMDIEQGQESLVDEVIRLMILQRQYRKRGVDVDIDDFDAFSRAVSTEDANIYSDLVRGSSTKSKRSAPLHGDAAFQDLVRGSSTKSKRSAPTMYGPAAVRGTSTRSKRSVPLPALLVAPATVAAPATGKHASI